MVTTVTWLGGSQLLWQHLIPGFQLLNVRAECSSDSIVTRHYICLSFSLKCDWINTESSLWKALVCLKPFNGHCSFLFLKQSFLMFEYLRSAWTSQLSSDSRAASDSAARRPLRSQLDGGSSSFVIEDDVTPTIHAGSGLQFSKFTIKWLITNYLITTIGCKTMLEYHQKWIHLPQNLGFDSYNHVFHSNTVWDDQIQVFAQWGLAMFETLHIVKPKFQLDTCLDLNKTK